MDKNAHVDFKKLKEIENEYKLNNPSYLIALEKAIETVFNAKSTFAIDSSNAVFAPDFGDSIAYNTLKETGVLIEPNDENKPSE